MERCELGTYAIDFSSLIKNGVFFMVGLTPSYVYVVYDYYYYFFHKDFNEFI